MSGEDAVAGVLTCRAGDCNYLQPPRRFGSCKAFDISRRTHHYPLRTLSPIFLQDWSTWQRIAGYWGASSKNAYPPDQRQLHLGGCFGQQGAEAQLQGPGVLRLTHRSKRRPRVFSVCVFINPKTYRLWRPSPEGFRSVPRASKEVIYAGCWIRTS